VDRLRHLHKNVGWLGTLQVALFHLLLALGAVGPFLTPQLPWYLSAAIVVMWTTPFVLRRRIVDNWEFTGPLIKRFGLVIVCTSAAAGLAGKDIKAQIPEEILITFIAATISLYISAMFWFTSDPSIEIQRKPKR
jgi:hypothetical protein